MNHTTSRCLPCVPKLCRLVLKIDPTLWLVWLARAWRNLKSVTPIGWHGRSSITPNPSPTYQPRGVTECRSRQNRPKHVSRGRPASHLGRGRCASCDGEQRFACQGVARRWQGFPCDRLWSGVPSGRQSFDLRTIVGLGSGPCLLEKHTLRSAS